MTSSQDTQVYPLHKISCTSLKGVGPHLADCLARLGILTIQDLLFHLPLRYQDRTHISTISELRPYEQAVVEGKIEIVEVVRRGKPNLFCCISDGTGRLYLRFFHFNMGQYYNLKASKLLRCYGEIRQGKYGLEMIHPEYKQIKENEPLPPVSTTLTPIYPTTEGLQQASLLKLTEQALNYLKQGISELLPTDILQQYNFPTLSEALQYVHRPPTDAILSLLENKQHPCQQRLIFEELLAHHLSLRHLRQNAKTHPGIPLPTTQKLHTKFLQQLPFPLTKAQVRVYHEIAKDLEQAHPMLRLVQGDVGSGKTVIAVLAALQAVENGYQVAIMAPTELLAEQHYQNFQRWLSPLNIDIAWLAGQVKGKTRTETLSKIVNGEVQIIVGTHALFQKTVEFYNLALVIIDEQHRFGVHQRLTLREKGEKNGRYPHQLILTATPIPRTLAMCAYADLDHSVIDELPPGRTPVQTVVISNQRRHEILARIHEACAQNRQVYWVCTLIEESEVLQCQAAENTAAELQTVLPEYAIGLVHGRLRAAEKEKIMADFKAHKYAILVATTVIEVGVDVPNASLMVIENAERLGLAQLHQLRGRVGRGSAISHCILLYQNPLSQLAKQRLAVMRETNDGFVIAQKDLQIRGPGEVLGTRQTGLMQLRIADLVRDQALLPTIQTIADDLLQKHPQISNAIIDRWLSQGGQYGSV